MHSSLADFEIHLLHDAPGFRCYAAGDDSESTRFTALISHEINQPATDLELGQLELSLGSDDDDMRSFYEHHNGLTMYCDSLSDNAGIRFFPIAEWSAITNEVRSEFHEMGLDELYGDLVDGVVIGEVCHSANYFFYQTVPERRGSIYYLMHDPLYEQGLRFESIADLLSIILNDPAQFLYEMGCYTRFSDGITEHQWIPNEYLSNAKGG